MGETRTREGLRPALRTETWSGLSEEQIAGGQGGKEGGGGREKEGNWRESIGTCEIGTFRSDGKNEINNTVDLEITQHDKDTVRYQGQQEQQHQAWAGQ